PAVAGRPRAEFLAELVGLRRSIVVAGAHGKSTTSAMVAVGLRQDARAPARVAFARRGTGHDPAWIVGATVPQLGSNAGAGEGWLVVEGDESDRSVFGLRPRVADGTHVHLDTQSQMVSR